MDDSHLEPKLRHRPIAVLSPFGEINMIDSHLVPELHYRPIAVDFVDNRLPRFHLAFSQHSSIYNAKLDRYITSSPSSSDMMFIDKPETEVRVPIKPRSVRGPPEILLSMRFWDKVFPDAMSKLAKTYAEPKGRYGNEHSIRDLEDWDQVYQLLENCREKYLGNKGWSKNVKKGWRHFTDNIGPLQQAWNLVPDIDYITPIRGTVEFLMDVSCPSIHYSDVDLTGDIKGYQESIRSPEANFTRTREARQHV